MNAAIIFPSDQISYNTGLPLLHEVKIQVSGSLAQRTVLYAQQIITPVLYGC